MGAEATKDPVQAARIKIERDFFDAVMRACQEAHSDGMTTCQVMGVLTRNIERAYRVDDHGGVVDMVLADEIRLYTAVRNLTVIARDEGLTSCQITGVLLRARDTINCLGLRFAIPEA